MRAERLRLAELLLERHQRQKRRFAGYTPHRRSRLFTTPEPGIANGC